jgi:hypothetical protein
VKLLVVSGVDHEESTCVRLAITLADLAGEAGAEVDIARPSDAAQPDWRSRVAAAGAHLWISPELRSTATDGPQSLYEHASIAARKVGLVTITGGATAAVTTQRTLADAVSRLGGDVARVAAAFSLAEVNQGLDDMALDRARAVVAGLVGP